MRLQQLRNRKMRQNAHIGTGRLGTVACKKTDEEKLAVFLIHRNSDQRKVKETVTQRIRVGFKQEIK